MASLSKEIGTQGVFEKSMTDFTQDPEMAESIKGLAEELLGRSDIQIGVASRGYNPREHAFNPDGDLDIYMDGIYAFGIHLDSEEVPAVFYSFNHKPGLSALDILQIQAVQAYPGVMPLRRWESFGLHLVEMFGEWRGDIASTMVRPVSENNWYDNSRKDSAFYQLGRLRYNIGSKRAGYGFDSPLKRFVKHLPPNPFLTSG